MSDYAVYVWPSHWQAHSVVPTVPTGNCPRCQLENIWIEDHYACDCLIWPWDRVDVGTPAVPELVWCCSECLKVQGPAWMGDVP